MSKHLPVQLVQQGRDPVHRSVAPLVRAYLRVHPAERARPVGGAGGAGGVRDGAPAVVGLEEVGAVPQEHVRHPRVLQEDGVEQGGPPAAVPDDGSAWKDQHTVHTCQIRKDPTLGNVIHGSTNLILRSVPDVGVRSVVPDERQPDEAEKL